MPDSMKPSRASHRSRRLIFFALLAAAIGGGLAYYFLRPIRPSIPPRFLERRAAVTKALEELERIKDVDIQPLTELEVKNDFKGAAALMARALVANRAYENVMATLILVGDELGTLALAVKPDSLGEKAIEAFSSLSRFAEAERRYYQNRRTLYETTENYYATRAAGEPAAVPENLAVLVDSVNADLKEAERLKRGFTDKIERFDEAAKGIE